jgi:hypothetical protein
MDYVKRVIRDLSKKRTTDLSPKESPPKEKKKKSFNFGKIKFTKKKKEPQPMNFDFTNQAHNFDDRYEDKYQLAKRRLKDFKKLWNSFESSIHVLSNSEYNQGATHARKDIKESLAKIVEILKVEDNENLNERTLGDCLEHFMANSMFEIIGTYTKSDRPSGFFKIGLRTIVQLIDGINCTSLLSQSNIHKTLVMMLNSILVAVSKNSIPHNSEHEVVDLITAV